MHVPSRYQVTDETIIEDFIRQNGLATLVSPGDGFPVATHIPLELEVDNGVRMLRGHVSSANTHAALFARQPQVLAIFLSPIDSYISSSWYDHPNVPTWNYMSVHVRGSLRIIEGEELRSSVRRLVDRYEVGMEKPVSLDGLPASVQRQLEGIIGFEIWIESIDASFKLSQNRSDKDIESIVRELRAKGDPRSVAMAQAVQEERAKRPST